MLNNPKFKILNYRDSEKKEFLTLLTIMGTQKNFLSSVQFELKNLAKQNTFNFNLNGLYKSFFFFGISQKLIFLDFFHNSGKKILPQILEQEVKRQKSLDFFNTKIIPFFEESDFSNDQFLVQTINNGQVGGGKKTFFFFFGNEKTKKLDKMFKPTLFFQHFLPNFSKIFLISTSFDFPNVSWGNLFKTKIFGKLLCFVFKFKTGFFKMNSKLQFLPCKGLLVRRHHFYFFFLGPKLKLSGVYFFLNSFCRIFSNLMLSIFEPFGHTLSLISTSKNNSKKRKKKKPSFIKFLKSKILENLIVNNLAQKFFFPNRTFCWIFYCIVNYIKCLLQKIFSQKKASILEKNQKKNPKIQKSKNPNHFNLIFQCGKFLGVLQTQNLIKKIFNSPRKPIGKILFSFIKKKNNFFYLQENVKKILYKGEDLTELVIHLETKKNKLEIALKMGKEQIQKNFLFRLIREGHPNIDFWIEVKNIWEILEISWTAKKNNNSPLSLALIPNFQSIDKMSNLLCIQKSQDWKKILKFLPKDSLGFILPSFLFSDFYKNSANIWCKSFEGICNTIINFEIFFSEIIGRKNFSPNSKSGIELARNFLLQNTALKQFFSLFYENKIFRFKFSKINPIEISIKKSLFKWKTRSFFKSWKEKWIFILNFLIFEIISNWRKYEFFTFDQF